MHEKGYADPIYSLDLLAAAALPEDEARYFVPVPEGRLVVRRELRVRAGNHTRAAVEDAVYTALAHHRRHAAAFAAHGFDGEWAEHLRRWTARMADYDGGRIGRRFHFQQAAAERQGLLRHGRALFTRLTICARLAGLSGLLLSGPVPRREADLLAALADGARRAALPEHAGRLAAAGFSAAHLQHLEGVLSAVAALRREGAEADEARQGSSAALAVVRGAILGDVALLCQVARLVLPPQELPRLRVRRLLSPAPHASAP